MSQAEKPVALDAEWLVLIAMLAALFWIVVQSPAATSNGWGTSEKIAIPLDQPRAATSHEPNGDGTSLRALPDGVHLKCALQRLEARVTPEGVRLASYSAESSADEFSLKPSAFGRDSLQPLAATGTIVMVDHKVQLCHAEVMEEYSASADGIRQDFVVTGSPSGIGVFVLKLGLSGARAEPTPYGARLVLAGSGREIAYSRLKVTDANGFELNAHLHVTAADELVITVDDEEAIYPIRIDPTYSDACWLAPGPGLNNMVRALAVSGNSLYVGGNFTSTNNGVGTLFNRIARWDGTNWSALGRGLNGGVLALAASGGDLYAGGLFLSAFNGAVSTVTVNHIAKWDGSNWSALGQGLDGEVQALVAFGGDLYAGGDFTWATNSGASAIFVNHIAKWDGSSWSSLGQGLNGAVWALSSSGGDLYAGGDFTRATNGGGGAIAVNCVAKWDGSNWSALGPGMDQPVISLTVSGNELYAGGGFWGPVSGPVDNCKIAKWNGSEWSALGLNVNGFVGALVVAGGGLYAGGDFHMATNSDGTVTTVNGIAEWNGNSWSALGSGVGNGLVFALAPIGSGIYVGGWFTTAGGNPAANIAKWVPLAFRTESVAVSNGVFNALITGPDSNRVVVDGTADFTSWSPVATNTLPPGGTWQLSVPTGPNPHQFYRARLGP